MTLRLDPALRAYAASAQVGLLGRLGRFDEAALVGARHYTEAVRAGIERGSGSSMALSLSGILFAAGRPSDARRYARRAMRLVDRPLRGSAVRLLATHYAWNDQFRERAELLAAERATIDESLRVHQDKRGRWAISNAEAVVLEPSGSDPRSSRAAWEDGVQTLFTLLEREDSPPVQRHAAATGAMLVAAGSARGWLANDDADRLRTHIETAIDDWPPHGTAPAIADFVRATLADADRAPGTGADLGLAAAHRRCWKTASCRSGTCTSARYRLATALIESGERDEAAALLARIMSEAPGHGVACLARWASELAEQARLLPTDCRPLRRRHRGRRPHTSRAAGARAGRRGTHKSADRPEALHQPQDRVGPRVRDPREDRRLEPRRGRCDVRVGPLTCAGGSRTEG